MEKATIFIPSETDLKAIIFKPKLNELQTNHLNQSDTNFKAIIYTKSETDLKATIFKPN